MSSRPDQPGPAGKMDDFHKQKTQEITPNAGPRVMDGVDLFLTADFIYWTARMDGLGYAVSGMRNSAAVPPQTPGKGDVKHPNFGFDPGFKLGLGFNTPHDGWDVYLQYTWLYTSDKTDSTSQADLTTSTLRPRWFAINQNGANIGPGTAISSARSTWDINFNNFDLELGRNFFVSRYLKMRPHFGLKAAWYDCDFSVRYTTAPANPVESEQFRVTQDQDWWGVGLRTGLNTAWQFNRNWSLFGNLALSSLWGKFDTDRRDQDRAPDNDDEPLLTNFHTEKDFHTVKPVIELALGLRWETWFSNDDYHFLIEAGWEEQVWWSHNQMYRIFEEGDHGSLVFQGLTLQLRFDF